jgi:hypothetical protein
MLCPYCGKENPADIQFCDSCGGPLALPVEEPVPEAQPVEPSVSGMQPPSQTPVSSVASSQSPPKAAGGIFGNRIWWVVGCFLLLCIIVGCGVLAWGLYHIAARQMIPQPATLTPNDFAAPTVVDSPLPSLSPSLTPLPQLSLTPIAISMTQGLIFSDNFSNPESGWDRIDQTDYYADYFNNAYRITVNSKMSDSWANPDDNIFGDVSILVDATKKGGPDDNDFGVICRYQNANQFYYAVISSDGYFGITKVTSVSSKLIGRDSVEFSDAIHQGFATNHIRFDCNGNKLSLYVNGQQLDQQTDGEYATGNVGLIAGTYDTPGTDILFNNFFVYKP